MNREDNLYHKCSCRRIKGVTFIIIIFVPIQLKIEKSVNVYIYIYATCNKLNLYLKLQPMHQLHLYKYKIPLIFLVSCAYTSTYMSISFYFNQMLNNKGNNCLIPACQQFQQTNTVIQQSDCNFLIIVQAYGNIIAPIYVCTISHSLHVYI